VGKETLKKEAFREEKVRGADAMNRINQESIS